MKIKKEPSITKNNLHKIQKRDTPKEETKTPIAEQETFTKTTEELTEKNLPITHDTKRNLLDKITDTPLEAILLPITDPCLSLVLAQTKVFESGKHINIKRTITDKSSKIEQELSFEPVRNYTPTDYEIHGVTKDKSGVINTLDFKARVANLPPDTNSQIGYVTYEGQQGDNNINLQTRYQYGPGVTSLNWNFSMKGKAGDQNIDVAMNKVNAMQYDNEGKTTENSRIGSANYGLSLKENKILDSFETDGKKDVLEGEITKIDYNHYTINRKQGDLTIKDDITFKYPEK